MTVRFVASAANETVWDVASERMNVQGPGAGGDRPLAVFAFGSGELESVPVGVPVVSVEPVGLVLVDPAVEEPDEEPEAPLVPAPVAETSFDEDVVVAFTPEVVPDDSVVVSVDDGAPTDPSKPVVEPVVEVVEPSVEGLVISPPDGLDAVAPVSLEDEPLTVEPGGADTAEPKPEST
jgi:hypothetical protein